MMIKIIEKNKLFFGLYFISFMGVFLLNIHEPLLGATLYFGAHRSAFFDFFFSYWTLLGEAYPYVLVILFFLFYLKDKQNATKVAIAGLCVMIFTGVLKEFFDFPRPALYLESAGLNIHFAFVPGVEINTGFTSFPSGHTASAFALWALTAFQFPQNQKVQFALFSTAFLVGLSRVYLTQHFPQDTLFGSAIGVVIAVLIEYYLSKKSLYA